MMSRSPVPLVLGFASTQYSLSLPEPSPVCGSSVFCPPQIFFLCLFSLSTCVTSSVTLGPRPFLTSQSWTQSETKQSAGNGHLAVALCQAALPAPDSTGMAASPSWATLYTVWDGEEVRGWGRGLEDRVLASRPR